MRFAAIVESTNDKHIHYVNPASVDCIIDRGHYREVMVGGYRVVHTKQTYAELLELFQEPAPVYGISPMTWPAWTVTAPLLPCEGETPIAPAEPFADVCCQTRYPSEEL